MPEALSLSSTLTEVNEKYIFTSTEMKIEVGDTKQVSFYPQVKLAKWDNEVNFSVRYTSDLTLASQSKDANNIITWIGKDNVAVKMYEVSDPNDTEFGGFEFEFELPEKPATNKFDMTIQTKGLRFIYCNISDDAAQKYIDQMTKVAKDYPEAKITIPASIEEAKLQIGPENTHGSYAAYHDSKRDNDYKTGKAFHIYRPKAIDKEGNWTWCEIKIDTDTGILSITVPQDFLDKAAYPVLVDPTFGSTTAGAYGAGSFFVSDQSPSGRVTANDSVSIDKITAYTCRTNDGTVNTKAYILSGTGTSNVPILTNGWTPGVALTSNSFYWQDFTYSTKPTVVNGNGYRLGIVGDNGFPGIRIRYDGTDGNVEIDYGWPYAQTETTWSSGNNYSNFVMSIYATYTGGGVTTPSIRRQVILEGVGRGIYDGVK